MDKRFIIVIWEFTKGQEQEKKSLSLFPDKQYQINRMKED